MQASKISVLCPLSSALIVFNVAFVAALRETLPLALQRCVRLFSVLMMRMVSSEKQKLRSRMLKDLWESSSEQIELASVAIAALLRSSEYFRSARCVFCFWPMPSEPQILEAMHGVGQVGLPRIDGKKMAFFEVDAHNARTSCIYNERGMHEPPEEAAPLAPEDADIILVPGLAFDLKGGRLGRGGGYYDRFLSDPRLRAKRIGVCFSCQIVEDLPRETHDQPMDVVITEEGIFECI